MRKSALVIGLGIAVGSAFGAAPAAAEPVGNCIGSQGPEVGKQACAGGGEPAFLALMHDGVDPGGSYWSDAQMLGWARQVCAMRDAGKTEKEAAGAVQTAMVNIDGGIHGAESRNLTSWAEYTMCRQYANFG